MVISRAELERLTQGDAPDTPIASILVPEHQLDKALARVLDLLKESNRDG
jgi:hypothetical protein